MKPARLTPSTKRTPTTYVNSPGPKPTKMPCDWRNDVCWRGSTTSYWEMPAEELAEWWDKHTREKCGWGGCYYDDETDLFVLEER